MATKKTTPKSKKSVPKAKDLPATKSPKGGASRAKGLKGSILWE